MGPGIEIARSAAAAGGRVELVARVADDPSGDRQLHGLTDARVGHVATLRQPSGSEVTALDAGDVELALRYLSDATTIVLVGADRPRRRRGRRGGGRLGAWPSARRPGSGRRGPDRRARGRDRPRGAAEPTRTARSARSSVRWRRGSMPASIRRPPSPRRSAVPALDPARGDETSSREVGSSPKTTCGPGSPVAPPVGSSVIIAAAACRQVHPERRDEGARARRRCTSRAGGRRRRRPTRAGRPRRTASGRAPSPSRTTRWSPGHEDGHRRHPGRWVLRQRAGPPRRPGRRGRRSPRPGVATVERSPAVCSARARRSSRARTTARPPRPWRTAAGAASSCGPHGRRRGRPMDVGDAWRDRRRRPGRLGGCRRHRAPWLGRDRGHDPRLETRRRRRCGTAIASATSVASSDSVAARRSSRQPVPMRLQGLALGQVEVVERSHRRAAPGTSSWPIASLMPGPR